MLSCIRNWWNGNNIVHVFGKLNYLKQIFHRNKPTHTERKSRTPWKEGTIIFIPSHGTIFLFRIKLLNLKTASGFFFLEEKKKLGKIANRSQKWSNFERKTKYEKSLKLLMRSFNFFFVSIAIHARIYFYTKRMHTHS